MLSPPPFVEAYLASNLGLYSGSSALLSPTSPSTSSSVPSLSQDSHMPSRHADERDRASPIASAAGSSQSRDSTSGNNSTSIGSSSNSIATNSSKRLDRHSRESLDGKSGGSSSSQSRAHSHATLRTDGHNHQDKSNGGGNREGCSGSHRRSSHVSPDPNSRRNSLDIKRESTDSERALKDVATKSGHSVPTETKIKDEKSDTDTSRLDNCNKKQVENNADSQQKEKQIAKDVERPTGSSEKISNCGEASGKTDSRQISSLSVGANDSDNVKTERNSPVASASANKTTEVRSRASEKGKANAEANDQAKEKVEGSDNSKEILNNNVESDSKKEKVQVDKDLTAEDEGRRKSTDSSSLRSEPIDIRPQRDIKESGSPEKIGSEVSLLGSSESNVVPGEGSPAGQKDPSRVKQEKSPVGSGGSSVGPAKVLTATSGGVVYAMYPAGQYYISTLLYVWYKILTDALNGVKPIDLLFLTSMVVLFTEVTLMVIESYTSN